MAVELVKKQVPQRIYELTYLVNSGLTSSELASMRDEIVTLIGKYKGKVRETEDWGKKTLAYNIKMDGKTHNEAFYTHVIMEMKADAMPKFENELKLKKGIIRHLIVKTDEVVEDKKTEK